MVEANSYAGLKFSLPHTTNTLFFKICGTSFSIYFNTLQSRRKNTYVKKINRILKCSMGVLVLFLSFTHKHNVLNFTPYIVVFQHIPADSQTHTHILKTHDANYLQLKCFTPNTIRFLNSNSKLLFMFYRALL